MSAALDSLRPIIDPKDELTIGEREEFSALWQPFSASRRSVITAQGETENYLYFVTEGLQRVCHYAQDGKESTIVFTFAPSFGGVLDSFFLQTPSHYTYETLTASAFIRAPFEGLDGLMRRYPNVMRLFHRGSVQALSGVTERLVELQSLTSEEKFRKLLKRSPHILQIVPHKYLANYIGIDPTNFSKLMNSVKL
jgi:CRP-like cAMP-binding protein